MQEGLCKIKDEYRFLRPTSEWMRASSSATSNEELLRLAFWKSINRVDRDFFFAFMGYVQTI